MKKVIAIALVRLGILLLLCYIATTFLTYRGFFPYKHVQEWYRLPKILSSLANFDGVHYVKIVTSGYDEYEQVFFPLYPLLIKFLAPPFSNNHLLTALAISNASFAIGFYYFLKLGEHFPDINFAESSLFLLAFPTAFFFSTAYTESLFFMLFITGLYFLYKKNFIAAGLLTAFASATRLAGIFLIIPFFLYVYSKKMKLTFKTILLTLSPLVGFGAYSLYLWVYEGNPFYYFTAQNVFATRSTHLILLPQVYYRYMRIFLTSQFNFAYFIAFIELVLFSVVFFVCLFEWWASYKERHIFRWSMASFSLITLVMPTLTGTFSSIPRYALLCISFYLVLTRLKSERAKIAIAALMGALQIILFAFFVQGYFVS